LKTVTLFNNPGTQWYAWEYQDSMSLKITSAWNRKRRKKVANIQENLKELFKVNGVKAAVLVGRDGLVYQGLSNDRETDIEEVGALLSSSIMSTDTTGQELRVGKLEQSIGEYQSGVLVTSALGGDAILCLVCDRGVNLGMVRFQVKKAAPGILSAL
jgi:predicted regulator of Ras-like GTPase activity (Roadblock/LC7/MglB family)